MDRNPLDKRPIPLNLPNPSYLENSSDPLEVYKRVTAEIADPFRRTRKRERVVEAIGNTAALLAATVILGPDKVRSVVRDLKEAVKTGIVVGLTSRGG